MPRGYGPRLDRGFGLDPVSRPQRTGARGSTRSADRSPAGPGGTVYPTVLEAYNRDSDFKRWLAGKRYFQGSGPSWADFEASFLIRTFRDLGSLTCGQLNTLTLFPSSGSPEGAWTVVNRRRGAIILPGALASGDISLDQSRPDPADHRLALDVSARLTEEQLLNWRALIGDQFEDSATSGGAGVRLLDSPDEVVAFTLVDVDVDGGRLLFDLSRPFMRIRVDPAYTRGYWKRVPYRQDAPLRWRADGSRFLCSSLRFHCSCPDFSGTSTANVLGGATGSQELFPRPAAGRQLTGQLESAEAGYRRRWRDLSPRCDQRRECKHIHAVRWSRGYPFYEPSDYPIGERSRQFLGEASPSLGSEAISRYQGRRLLELDRAVISLADSASVLVDSRDIIPEDEETPTTAERAPILWTSLNEPPPGRARIDDWWLQRGTSELRVFDPARERFVDTVLVDGTLRPVIELWPEGTPAPLNC